MCFTFKTLIKNTEKVEREKKAAGDDNNNDEDTNYWHQEWKKGQP